MPLVQTKGAGSAQGVGQFTQQVAANYIEDVFSTWLYTGNGSTQTITNGIDLSSKGGLVWTKNRNGTGSNALVDTVRGATKVLSSNLTDGTLDYSTSITSFTSSGYAIGADSWFNAAAGNTYASWTFRKQAKFFDVVTYTGDGNSTKTVNHNLGSVPGCILIKATVADSGQSNGNWIVLHRSIPNNYLMLNSTSAQNVQSGATTGTSTTFNAISGLCNGNGITYVAYLFAHDAGGFGAAGTDNVISCGSFQDNGSGTNLDVTLGYEPQWLLVKAVDSTGNWFLADSMRSFVANPGTTTSVLYPNLTNAESTWNIVWGPTATGFQWNQNSGRLYIYIAIRRGPMRTPTSGTSVFSPVARVGTGATANVTAGFAPDMAISAYRTTGEYMPLVDKLRGPTRWLTWQQLITNAESTGYDGQWFIAFTNTGVTVGADNGGGKSVNSSGGSLIQYFFQRAPGFFDVVCYTGNGTTLTANHNLGVVPEMMIIKRRDTSGNWSVYTATTGVNKVIELNSAYGAQTASYWGTGPTATTFQVQSNVNTGNKFVAYLFASCPGVSKVGSYTGTGTTQQINCGFTGGARFVLIKRTDDNSSGTANWFVWDSARGIVAGNDPYLLLNSTAAEVTSTDYIDTLSTGFEISSTAPAAINANGGSFIFLAIS